MRYFFWSVCEERVSYRRHLSAYKSQPLIESLLILSMVLIIEYLSIKSMSCMKHMEIQETFLKGPRNRLLLSLSS